MKRALGFTLIELAIVLVIITLLIGGLAMPLSAQIQARRVAETRQTLNEAREAIIGYAMSHTIAASCTCGYAWDADTLLFKRQPPPTSTCPVSLCPPTAESSTPLILSTTRHYLPCPDALDSGDGVEEERQNGNCPSPEGFLPWVTLGAAAQDAWGNRLRYRVTPAFAADSGFLPTDVGDQEVCSSSACPAVDVADKVPVVLLSHGSNGRGARNVSGADLAAPGSGDELENTDADTRFVSRSPTAADSPAGEFDDLVGWIPDSLLRSRLCPAGGCP